jgi:hypothetical protein
MWATMYLTLGVCTYRLLVRLRDVATADAVHYYLPMILATAGGMWAFAPRQHLPLVSLVQSTLLSFRVLPVVLTTLIKPFGHPFKVKAAPANRRTIREASSGCRSA